MGKPKYEVSIVNGTRKEFETEVGVGISQFLYNLLIPHHKPPKRLSDKKKKDLNWLGGSNIDKFTEIVGKHSFTFKGSDCFFRCWKVIITNIKTERIFTYYILKNKGHGTSIERVSSKNLSGLDEADKHFAKWYFDLRKK